MYKTINGYTKDAMKQKIREGNNGEKALSRSHLGPRLRCSYLTPTGNKCAVGCFIPEGHIGVNFPARARALLEACPDLKPYMPLEPVGLERLQFIHDAAGANQDIRELLFNWIDENVVEDGQ